MWLLCGAVSVFFTALTLILTFRGKNDGDWASICALSFTAVTLLLEYKMVMDWVSRKDWAALADVLPTMFTALTGYVILQILLNAIALGIRATPHNGARRFGERF